MDFSRFASFALIAVFSSLVACTQKQSPEEIRQKTAQATAEAKEDTKAVAQGIREGLTSNKQIDLNTASKDQLLTLPGLTNAEADHILAARPFHDPGELVTRHIVTGSEYDRISNRVTATR
jgi:competence protein ComEA